RGALRASDRRSAVRRRHAGRVAAGPPLLAAAPLLGVGPLRTRPARAAECDPEGAREEARRPLRLGRGVPLGDRTTPEAPAPSRGPRRDEGDPRLHSAARAHLARPRHAERAGPPGSTLRGA